MVRVWGSKRTIAKVTKWKSPVSRASTRLVRVRISPTSSWLWAKIRKQARVSDINGAAPCRDC